MPHLRQTEGIYSQVRDVQDLLQESGEYGADSGGQKGQLVIDEIPRLAVKTREGGRNRMSMTTDPIADMLTRIRNASMSRHEIVDIPASNVKREMARILKEEGFIKSHEFIDDGKQGTIRLRLKYTPEKACVINGLKRISKPGRRVYARKDQIPKVLGGFGIAILSTSCGLLTDKEARRKGVGGEVLCYIW